MAAPSSPVPPPPQQSGSEPASRQRRRSRRRSGIGSPAPRDIARPFLVGFAVSAVIVAVVVTITGVPGHRPAPGVKAAPDPAARLQTTATSFDPSAQAVQVAQADAVAPLARQVTCPPELAENANAPLLAACGRLKVLMTRIRDASELDMTDPRSVFAGRTALHHAVQRGDARMTAALLAAGARPNATDSDGNTPLHLLAQTDDVDHPEYIAKELIRAGASVDVVDHAGFTPIQLLESDHKRLMAEQALAQVLFQDRREEQLKTWLDHPQKVPGGNLEDALPGKSVTAAEDASGHMELDTSQGRISIPAPAANPPNR